jgi:hypothetical protein
MRAELARIAKLPGRPREDDECLDIPEEYLLTVEYWTSFDQANLWQHIQRFFLDFPQRDSTSKTYGLKVADRIAFKTITLDASLPAPVKARAAVLAELQDFRTAPLTPGGKGPKNGGKGRKDVHQKPPEPEDE